MALHRLFILTLLSIACLALAKDSEDSFSSVWHRHCEQDTPVPVGGEVEGRIPEWVEGRLTRVGPGIHHFGNTSYIHAFDPLAVLHMVQIQDGEATYTSRFLESDTYKTNTKEQRIAIPEFGTAAFPDPCQTLFQKFTSWFQKPEMGGDNCVVNVVQVKDEMIAMTEGPIVRVVDPRNLKVIGEGVKLTDYIPVKKATAHPHIGKDGTIYNVAATSKGYAITSHRNGDVRDAEIEATISPRWRFDPSYMHSFSITENYFILIEIPMTVNFPAMMAALTFNTPFANAIIWHPNEQTKFRVIRRSDGEEVDVIYMANKFFTYHTINAYEVDDLIVLDISTIASGEAITSLYLDNLAKKGSDPTKMMFESIATRYVLPIGNIANQPYNEDILQDTPEIKIVPEDSALPVRSPSAVRTGKKEFQLKGVPINDDFFEMPRINYAKNGELYRYVYGVGRQTNTIIDFSSIIKLDVKTGKNLVWSDPDYYVSEPVFLSEPDNEDEDAGVLLTVLLHKEEANRLALLILDARNLNEMARVQFTAQGVVTPTFHGQFVSFNEDMHSY